MDNVGLKRGQLEILDYREDYARIYEKEKERYKQIGYIAENYDYVIDLLNKNL